MMDKNTKYPVTINFDDGSSLTTFEDGSYETRVNGTTSRTSIDGITKHSWYNEYEKFEFHVKL
jgi:hypothetical protein